ncbi:hypothetical protein LSH36_150g06007 [Paralvinella palmiformis]|uniref:C2 domain-containing protein n=1 Tax=Paralvinella palmiformis TaxID=53620 RepID=A0AAD9N7F0_9ANNE|nr:hypothetical protein LSH36_150g06007 [Paralvinella palmiformis]
MELTETDRIAIIAGCLAFLVTILIICICKLSARCWLNRHCLQKRNNEQEYRISSDAVKVKHYKATGSHSHVTLSHPQVERWRDTTGDSTSSDGDENYRVEIEKAGTTQNDNIGTTQTYLHGSSSDSPLSDSGSDLSGSCLIKGEIGYSLFYPEEDGGDTQGQLHVWIRKVENLIIRRNNKVKVCVKVQLLKKESNIDRFLRFFQFLDEEEQQGNIEFEAQTSLKPIHKSLEWQEHHCLPLSRDQIQDRCVRLVCCLHDHLSHYTQIGQVIISLNDATFSEEVAARKPLTPVRQEIKGELRVTLTYLPTAEKLVVTPSESKQLKYIETKYPSSIYVRVALTSRGSFLKYKTREKDIQPRMFWEDSFTFDVPQDQLPDVNIVATVRQSVTFPDRKRDTVIGRLVLGARNCPQKGQQQWNAILLNPRQAQSEWHNLI